MNVESVYVQICKDRVRNERVENCKKESLSERHYIVIVHCCKVCVYVLFPLPTLSKNSRKLIRSCQDYNISPNTLSV